MDQLWSALTAIGTLLSALVITVTVIMAARQVRLTQEQVRATNRNLEQLQRTTQLEGVMEIFRELSAPQVQESAHFIRTELFEKMKDPSFRASASKPVVTDTSVHKELVLMRLFERIGAIVKHGLIDPSVMFDVAHPVVTIMWEILDESGYFAMRQKSVGGPVWENFEYLYRAARRWLGESGSPEDHL
jgi:hypothetical protein